MSFASTRDYALVVHEGVTADSFDGFTLLDPSGETLHRHGVEESPPLTDDGWQAGSSHGHWLVRSLEGYGQSLGIACWWTAGAPSDKAERQAAHAAQLLGHAFTQRFELDELSRALAEAYESTHLIHDLARGAMRTKSRREMCEELLAALARQVSCRGGGVLLAEQANGLGPWIVQATSGAVEGLRVDAALTSDDRLHEVAAQGPSVDDAVSESEDSSVLCLAETSRLVVPLRVHDAVDGAVVLFDRTPHAGGSQAEPFSSHDLLLAEGVATQGTAMMHGMRMAALAKEMELGQRIQRALLPKSLPSTERLDVAGQCSMAGQVGGDVYDAVLGADGLLRVGIADVSGHDLGAAILMASARALLRAELQDGRSPAEIVQRLNARLYDDLSGAGLFLTHFVIEIDSEAETLTCSGGGHNPLLVIRPGDEPEWIASTGLPAGLTPDARFGEVVRPLPAGSRVLLYTDGLTEAMGPDGTMFGEERLAAYVAEDHPQCDASEILSGLEESVRRFAQKAVLEDDGTAVLVRTLASSPGSSERGNPSDGGTVKLGAAENDR